jgi:hypothetical protein
VYFLKSCEEAGARGSIHDDEGESRPEKVADLGGRSELAAVTRDYAASAESWLLDGIVTSVMLFARFAPNFCKGFTNLLTNLPNLKFRNLGPDLPLGISDLPVGISDLPLGLSDLPLGSSDLPLGSSALPLESSDLPPEFSDLPIGFMEGPEIIKIFVVFFP